MEHRSLGRCGLDVSVLGFGAFKIGRNQGIRYERGYDLPDDAEASRLLHAVLDLGITLIDTAPAYGLAEERIGHALASRRGEFRLCTKAGETFQDGRSCYDFSGDAIRRSVRESLRRLRTDHVDLLLLHSDGRDAWIQAETDAVTALHDLRDAGFTRAIGFSGKTVEGADAALTWADVLMVEYHPADASHADVIRRAAHAGVGILVKKPFAAGRIPPSEALPFLLRTRGVGSIIFGGLNAAHVRENVAIAARCV